MTKHDFDFDFTKLKQVPISSVRANGWNPKDKDTKEYKQVVRSIQENGLRDPVIVRELEDGEYEIVDGEQRYTAAYELGYEKIWVYNEGKLDEKQAKALTIWYQVQVPFNDIDLSHLVVELDELSVSLPYTEVEIEDFKNMANFDFSDYGDERPEDEKKLDNKTLKLVFGEAAFAVVMEAINRVKEDNDCSESRAVELICADYLAGL